MALMALMQLDKSGVLLLVKEEYNKLIKCIELKRIVLCSLNCQLNSDIFKQLGPGQAKVDFKPSFNLKSKDEKSIYAEANFNVNVFEDDKNEKLFNIESSFLLIYEVKEECEDKAIEEFIKRNVPLNAWPYGREIISNLTSKMGLPPLNIGLYKVF